MYTEIQLGLNDDNRRADRILRKFFPNLPLSTIHRLFRQGKVHIDGKKILASHRVRDGQSLVIKEKLNLEQAKEARTEKKMQEADFTILLKNSDFLVINKEAGRLVHGKNSLDEQVSHFLLPQLPPSASFRPGPLHRLDLGTSGLIVFSASLRGSRIFSQALREQHLQKIYIAVLQGEITKRQKWEHRLQRDANTKRTNISADGKRATSYVQPLKTGAGLSLVYIEIIGGRTHQIRAQAAAMALPLINDRKYGGKTRQDFYGGQFFLHAYSIGHNFPALKLPSTLYAPLPKDILPDLQRLFGSLPFDNI